MQAALHNRAVWAGSILLAGQLQIATWFDNGQIQKSKFKLSVQKKEKKEQGVRDYGVLNYYTS